MPVSAKQPTQLLNHVWLRSFPKSCQLTLRSNKLQAHENSPPTLPAPYSSTTLSTTRQKLNTNTLHIVSKIQRIFTLSIMSSANCNPSTMPFSFMCIRGTEWSQCPKQREVEEKVGCKVVREYSTSSKFRNLKRSRVDVDGCKRKWEYKVQRTKKRENLRRTHVKPDWTMNVRRWELDWEGTRCKEKW